MQKKVMIVDDDPDILITIRELLEPEGFEVLTVQNGKECIDELENGFKGVILMDIMMPYMDGWTTLRQIITKGFHKDNIISMISAKDECDWRFDDLKQYIQNYITKPFDSKQLVNLVKGYFSPTPSKGLMGKI
jgi:DNA-binding response OmpR family regulator